MHNPPKDDKSLKTIYNEATNDFHYENNDSEDRNSNLSRQRIISSIPKSDYTPSHQPNQPGGQEKWIYPSEQQYYNAIRRKGYNPREADIPITLAIHNTVNEQGWSKIKEWEYFHGNKNPKLIRFMGKPRPLSPKAFILSKIGYYKMLNFLLVTIFAIILKNFFFIDIRSRSTDMIGG
jgi:hypothetical protein